MLKGERDVRMPANSEKKHFLVMFSTCLSKHHTKFTNLLCQSLVNALEILLLEKDNNYDLFMAYGGDARWYL